jgi:hypothetical protein
MSDDKPKDVQDGGIRDDRLFHTIIMDEDTPHDTQIKLAKLEYRYSSLGLAVGTVALLGGMLLFLNSIFGSTNWAAKFLGAESTISDAAPGSILFVVGLFIIIATRPKVQHKRMGHLKQ